MQVTETEIILPLNVNYKNLAPAPRNMLSLCLFGLVLLGAGIYLLIPNEGVAPTTGEALFPIWLIVLSILILLPSLTALVMSLQGENSHAPRFVRIDREGICISHLFGVALSPTVVKWSDISTLAPSTLTYWGHSIAVLGIVPHDPEALLGYILENRSRSFFSRFVARANVYLYRRAHALSPFFIPQAILPISIDELIALIQGRFAHELSEHRVAVLGW